MSRKIAGILLFGVIWWAALPLQACPFCVASKPSLGQRIAAADVACFAQLESVTAANDPAAAAFGIQSWKAAFNIDKVLAGASHLPARRRVELTLVERPVESSAYLLIGNKDVRLDWSQPIAVSERARRYVDDARRLPAEGSERLRYFLPFLNDKEPLLAEDAYAEFAQAPFASVAEIRDELDREPLIRWLADDKTPRQHLGLLFTLLSLCGTEADADLLERLIRSDGQPRQHALDSRIACYLSLARETGLRNIRQWFLTGSDIAASPAEIHAAIGALRFHGEQQHVFSRAQIGRVLQELLEEPEFATAVIPDLARWEDWSVADRLAHQFLNADEKYAALRAAIVRYLEVCPLPKAKQHLAHFADVAPEKLRRAKSGGLFPPGFGG